MKEKYMPGEGCLCHAHSEEECGCNVDWTPREVYELREKLSAVTGERDEAVNNYETAVLREHRMQEQRDRLAAWIVNNPPKYGGDHACAECYPHSDCLVDGFVCGFHTAIALAAVKGGQP